jgi:hypothetical protein
LKIVAMRKVNEVARVQRGQAHKPHLLRECEPIKLLTSLVVEWI